MKKNINAEIAELLIRAQNASDGGKHKHKLAFSKKAQTDNIQGYRYKSFFVRKALDMIAANKTDFKFAVVIDREEIAKYIVYFQTTIDGTKYQVSFHSYDDDLKRFIKKSFRIKWDHLDSRKASQVIYHHYFKNGTYDTVPWYRDEGVMI